MASPLISLVPFIARDDHLLGAFWSLLFFSICSSHLASLVVVFKQRCCFHNGQTFLIFFLVFIFYFLFFFSHVKNRNFGSRWVLYLFSGCVRAIEHNAILEQSVWLRVSCVPRSEKQLNDVLLDTLPPERRKLHIVPLHRSNELGCSRLNRPPVAGASSAEKRRIEKQNVVCHHTFVD